MPQSLSEWILTVVVVVILVYCLVIVASDEDLLDHISDVWRVYVH